MGLFIGDKQIDMFSMLHSKRCLKAVDELPVEEDLTEGDVGQALCLISPQDGYQVGHIYKVTAGLQYQDLNQGGAVISAFYMPDGTLRT